MSWYTHLGKVLTEDSKIAVDESCCCGGCCENMPRCISAEYENGCGIYTFTMCFRQTAPEFTPPHHFGSVRISCRPDAYNPCGDTRYVMRFYLHTFGTPESENNCVLTWYCDRDDGFGETATTEPSGTCDPFDMTAGVAFDPGGPCHPCLTCIPPISPCPSVWRGYE